MDLNQLWSYCVMSEKAYSRKQPALVTITLLNSRVGHLQDLQLFFYIILNDHNKRQDMVLFITQYM